MTGTLADTIGQKNPIRYRGYYYDSETGFYYLKSRYYNPEIGRFLNADGQMATVGGDLQGYNVFAYCMNNPVNMCDTDGNWPKLSSIVNVVKKGIKTVAKAVTACIVGVSVIQTIDACMKNIISSKKEPDYEAVNKLLEDRYVSEENVHIPKNNRHSDT